MCKCVDTFPSMCYNYTFHCPRSAKMGGGGVVSPTLFRKSKKNPDFWKKDHDCVHPWVFSSTLSFESIFVKNYWKLFPPHFFLDLLAKCLSKCLVPRNLPCPGKSLVAPL